MTWLESATHDNPCHSSHKCQRISILSILYTHTIRPAVTIRLIWVLHATISVNKRCVWLGQASQHTAMISGHGVAYPSTAADLCVHQLMRQHVWHVNVSIRSPLFSIVEHGHNALRLGLKIFTRLWLFIVNVFLKKPRLRSILA